MRYIVTGSRTYAPTSDVGVFLDNHKTDVSALVGIGSSPVCDAAAQWAKSTDVPFSRMTLDRDRENLYRISAEPDTYTVLFACRAPNSRNLTEGIARIIHAFHLSTHRFEVIESPLPGRICNLITKLNHAIERYGDMGDADPVSDFAEIRQASRRKRDQFTTIIELGIELNQLSGRLKKKMDDETGNYDEWYRSLKTYEAIESTLADTKSRISGIRLDGE